MEEDEMFRLPLPSGTRAWLENLSAYVAEHLSPPSSDISESARTAQLEAALSELGSRVRLVLAQDEAAHELGQMGRREANDGRVRGSRPEQDSVHYVPGTQERYLELARARGAAAKAFKAGKKKRRRRSRGRK